MRARKYARVRFYEIGVSTIYLLKNRQNKTAPKYWCRKEKKMRKESPPEIYKQLIKNDEPIFAIYRDENKVHSFSRVLFFAVLENEEYIQNLIYDSDLGLSPADRGNCCVGYFYGPIEHIDYANY